MSSNLLRKLFLSSSLRQFSLSRILKNNEGKNNRNLERIDEPIDEQFHYMPIGKSDVSMQTRVSFISKDMDSDGKVGIRTISSEGFRLLDNQFMYGPIAIFPKTVLSWRVCTIEEITPESLELFVLLEPRLDMLIIGAGDHKDIDKVNAKVAPTLKAHKIPYEILSTEFAILTFNFMNNDGRYVAAALFPPQDMLISTYQHGKAMQLLRSFDETEFNPLLIGDYGSTNKDEMAINMFYAGEPKDELEDGKRRILELRTATREKRARYFENRRKHAEEEQILSLIEAKKNWAFHLEECAKEAALHGDIRTETEARRLLADITKQPKDEKNKGQ